MPNPRRPHWPPAGTEPAAPAEPLAIPPTDPPETPASEADVAPEPEDKDS